MHNVRTLPLSLPQRGKGDHCVAMVDEVSAYTHFKAYFHLVDNYSSVTHYVRATFPRKGRLTKLLRLLIKYATENSLCHFLCACGTKESTETIFGSLFRGAVPYRASIVSWIKSTTANSLCHFLWHRRRKESNQRNAVALALSGDLRALPRTPLKKLFREKVSLKSSKSFTRQS